MSVWERGRKRNVFIFSSMKAGDARVMRFLADVGAEFCAAGIYKGGESVRD